MGYWNQHNSSGNTSGQWITHNPDRYLKPTIAGWDLWWRLRWFQRYVLLRLQQRASIPGWAAHEMSAPYYSSRAGSAAGINNYYAWHIYFTPPLFMLWVCHYISGLNHSIWMFTTTTLSLHCKIINYVSGPCFTMKNIFPGIGISIYKGKMFIRPSHCFNGISYSDKDSILWILNYPLFVIVFNVYTSNYDAIK